MSLVAWKAGPIAIDLGDYAVRVLQRTGGPGAGWVSDCHFYPPKARGERPTAEELCEAVRTLMRRQRFKGRRVVTALPARDMVVKNIRLPRVPDEELDSVVRFEALDRIPGLDADAEVRFLKAAPLPGRQDGQQEVIVFAVKGAVVRQHLEMLESLGLESAGLDVAPLAALRAFQHRLRRDGDRDRVLALADLGRGGMRFAVARGSDVTFTKTFEFGGEHLDALVSRKLGINFEEAGTLRRQIAAERRKLAKGAPQLSDTAAKIEEAVREGWDQLGKEIALCLRYYAVTFRGPKPDEVTCVGGEALDPLALEYLSQVVGTPCRVGLPFRAAGLSEERAAVDDNEAEWATVAGLAIKPIGRRGALAA